MLGAALSAGTQAATVSYSFASDTASTDFNFNGHLGFFDSTLGSLTGVSLEVYGEFTAELTIGNAGQGTMRSGQMKTSYNMLFSSSLPSLDELLAEAQEESPWVSWSIDTGKVRLGPNSFVTYGPITQANVGVLDASSVTTSFATAGGGEFGLNCITQTGAYVEMGAAGWFKQTTTGACSATITYTYDEAPPLPPPTTDVNGDQVPMPVPEPPSLAILGLALAYMAARGRTRKLGTA